MWTEKRQLPERDSGDFLGIDTGQDVSGTGGCRKTLLWYAVKQGRALTLH